MRRTIYTWPLACLVLAFACQFATLGSKHCVAAKVDDKQSSAQEAKNDFEDGEVATGDKGKYKRRHTRVMEFLLSNEPQKARGRLDKWFKADPDDPENYYMLAVIECQTGNIPKAVAAMNRAQIGAAARPVCGWHAYVARSTKRHTGICGDRETVRKSSRQRADGCSRYGIERKDLGSHGRTSQSSSDRVSGQ